MKNSDKYENRRVIIMVMVAIVALAAIMAASKDSNIGGEAVKSPIIQCDEEDYCLNWEWMNVSEVSCLKYEFLDFKICSKYSWPENENGEFELQCDTWDMISQTECVEWGVETTWQKECTSRSIRRDCYALV
ncbi:MAG: hypothetical protein ABIB43_03390 [archaeon]